MRNRPRRLARALLGLSLGLTGLAREAMAGPMNVETLASAREQVGWTALSSTSLGFRYGNIDKLDFGQTGVLQFQTLFPNATEGAAAKLSPFMHQRLLLATNLAFSLVTAQRIVNTGYAHARFTTMWHRRFGMELFLQTQYNEFTLLRSRLLAGTGVRVEAVHREHFRLWGGTGYMVEHEVLNVVRGDPHPGRLVNHRWSSYVGAVLQFAKGRISVQETLYVQPLWARPSDVRVLSDLGVIGKVTEVLSLGFNLEINYDSMPPQTIAPLDLSLRSAVTLRFG